MRWSAIVVGILAMLFLSVTLECRAEDEGGEAQKKVTLKGDVSIATDEDGNITDVFLSTWDDIYDVVLNAKGKKLGEEMEEKTVEVDGTIKEEDDRIWLTVMSYKESADDDAADDTDEPEDEETQDEEVEDVQE